MIAKLNNVFSEKEIPCDKKPVLIKDKLFIIIPIAIAIVTEPINIYWEKYIEIIAIAAVKTNPGRMFLNDFKNYFFIFPQDILAGTAISNFFGYGLSFFDSFWIKSSFVIWRPTLGLYFFSSKIVEEVKPL